MKYKILLAEDEEDVRISIGNYINDSDTPFEVIGEASDGVEAIEMMRTLNPDILITDVCMPHLNGLEMLKDIREFNPDIPTVIISGYDEFSYAKEAMRLGVKEYLLKPFLPRELLEVLHRIGEDLEQQSQLRRNLEGMNQQLEQVKNLAQEHFIRLVLEDGEAAEIAEAAKQSRFALDARWYAAGILRFTSMAGNRLEHLSGDNLQEYLEIIKENYVPRELIFTEAKYGVNQIVVFFASRVPGHARFLEMIQESVEKMARSMEHYHGIWMQCMLGEACPHHQKLSLSYSQALDLWKKMITPDQVFLRYCDVREMEKEREKNSRELDVSSRMTELEGYLLFHTETDHLQAALEELDKLFDIYAGFPMEKSEYVSVALVKLVLKLSDLVSKSGEKLQAWEDEDILHFLKNHLQYGSLQEARQVLAGYIEKCCCIFSKVHENQGDRMICEARTLIGQNLSNEGFGLEQLSDMLHFSSNYVRQVFKAKTGENFSDYLFRSRMELASELLKDPVNRIQDVALLTGYSNQRYFARCFKKYFGCTPTEYRCDL